VSPWHSAASMLSNVPCDANLLVLYIVNLNHFRLLRVVGKGAFGKVRIVERKDSGLTFALKYIRKDEGEFAWTSTTTSLFRFRHFIKDVNSFTNLQIGIFL
jgi:hypothetical protein